MTGTKATDRYGTLAIGLHWLTLAVLIAVYSGFNLKDLYPEGSDPREALKTWHFTLGLTILALVSEVHEMIGMIGCYIIGAHALAALYHQFVSRDNTLTNMLPRRP